MGTEIPPFFFFFFSVHVFYVLQYLEFRWRCVCLLGIVLAGKDGGEGEGRALDWGAFMDGRNGIGLGKGKRNKALEGLVERRVLWKSATEAENEGHAAG